MTYSYKNWNDGGGGGGGGGSSNGTQTLSPLIDFF
jgi:hypothetical protein